ncbi:hypothetical protein [Streptomyces sp. SUK 48]|uniref:hypothetical protein n=1 Tax=Streptomyces sp. SUK 48 TaxID=2582831 RepID=UPI00129A30AD|nr:hypothetical protein [Streptomyces sp. SUK 48]
MKRAAIVAGALGVVLLTAGPAAAAEPVPSVGEVGGLIGTNVGSINALNNVLANSNFLNHVSALNNLLGDTDTVAAILGN